jgi:hypothetical protein
VERLGPYQGWAVLALALGVRLCYLFEIDDGPLFRHPVVDAETYARHAAALAGGNWLGRGEGPFWQPPLYPYFLGVVKTLFPDAFWHAARLLQCLLGTLSCGLTWWLGRRFFSPGIALAAGLAAALYGPLIYHDGELLPATLGTCLNLLGLALLARGRWLGAGAALGLAGLAVAPSLVFAAAALGWIAAQGWKEGRALARAGLFALGVGLVLAPVGLRNYLVGGDAVLLSYNGGVNFYLGNNPDYERTVNIRPGWEWDDLVGMPLEAGIVRPGEKSRFFYAKAWEYIRSRPLDYLGLLCRKAWSFWQGDEPGRNQDVYYWRNHSVLLSGLLWKYGLAFPFGLVAPLALLGMGLAWRRREWLLPLLLAASHFAAATAFFVADRYRLPAVPALLLFAACGAGWLWEKRRPWALAGAGVLLVLCNWNLPPMRMEGDAAIHYNLGQAHAKEGRVARARAEYAEAVRLDSTYWQAWLNLGSAEALLGRMGEAAEIFARVARARPMQLEAWMNLAHARLALEQGQAAQEAYAAALALPSPHRPRLYVELMGLHLRAGDFGAAERVLAQAEGEYPQEAARLAQLYGQMKAKVLGR